VQKYGRPGEPHRQILPDCMDVLLSYHWPGNIRELENAIERACVTCTNGSIHLENLPPEVLNKDAPKLPFSVDLKRDLPNVLAEMQAQIEKLYIRKALEHCHGHVGRCAEICGVSRRSLSAKLAAYGIDRKKYQDHADMETRRSRRLLVPDEPIPSGNGA